MQLINLFHQVRRNNLPSTELSPVENKKEENKKKEKKGRDLYEMLENVVKSNNPKGKDQNVIKFYLRDSIKLIK